MWRRISEVVSDHDHLAVSAMTEDGEGHGEVLRDCWVIFGLDDLELSFSFTF